MGQIPRQNGGEMGQIPRFLLVHLLTDVLF